MEKLHHHLAHEFGCLSVTPKFLFQLFSYPGGKIYDVPFKATAGPHSMNTYATNALGFPASFIYAHVQTQCPKNMFVPTHTKCIYKIYMLKSVWLGQRCPIELS